MYKVAEVYFDDRAAFDRAAASAEWQAMAPDAQDARTTKPCVSEPGRET